MPPRLACKPGYYFLTKLYKMFFFLFFMVEEESKRIEKIIIFIDGNNLYHNLERMFNNEKKDFFNFKKFIKHLANDRKVIETYYYIGIFDLTYNSKIYANQQRFFSKLRKIKNFNLFTCRMQKVKIDGKNIYQTKEDDIRLALDMVKLTDKYDTAILVSNDGDFVPVVKFVQEKGKKVENIGIGKSPSYYLKQVCDRFRKLNKREILQLLGN